MVLCLLQLLHINLVGDAAAALDVLLLRIAAAPRIGLSALVHFECGALFRLHNKSIVFDGFSIETE